MVDCTDDCPYLYVLLPRNLFVTCFYYLGIANLANAGDSRAVLSRGNKAVDVARDMKATDSCEIARIAKAGGYVSRGRVNGSLAIARAIGNCCNGCNYVVLNL